MAIIFNVFALALTAGLLCSLPLSFDVQLPSEKSKPKHISESDFFYIFGNDPFKMKIKRHLGKVGKCADGKIWILGLCKSPNFNSGESDDIKTNAIPTTSKPVLTTKSESSSDHVPITKTDMVLTAEPALDVVPLSKPKPTGAVTTDKSTHVTPPTKSLTTIDVVTSTTSASVVSTKDVTPKTETVPNTDVLYMTIPVPTIKVVPTTEPDSDTVEAQAPNIISTTGVEFYTDLTSTTVQSNSDTVPGTQVETLHDENQGKELSTKSPKANNNYDGQTVDFVLFIAFFIIVVLIFVYEKCLRRYVSSLSQSFRSQRSNQDENQTKESQTSEDFEGWRLLSK